MQNRSKTGKGKKGTTQRKTGGYIINLKISSKTKGPSNRYMLGIKYIEEKKVQEFRQSGKEGTGKKGTIKFLLPVLSEEASRTLIGGS